MARINSWKRNPGNGRRRNDFEGNFVESFPIVFSNGNLILNMTDGERAWSVWLNKEETEALRKRFPETKEGA